MRRPRPPPGAAPAACAGAAAAAAPEPLGLVPIQTRVGVTVWPASCAHTRAAEGSATVPSAGRNEERRRAWRASRESRLQPLPSCEACATPSPEEVRSWAQSFDKLMHSPAGRSVFREFLRTEYSEENMLFWLACEELKAEANQHVVDEKARLIYEDYVSILSPKEVSLDSRVREGVNKKMQEPSAHTFDDAQLQIYTLMHRDSYPRFLSSPAYRALLLRGRSTSSSEA
ncbi:regulator of G-protein signaling 19 isoform X2 [Phocoena sinus]|uniref:regulator of G-protein signaling 19 isoform X2 n=1 Tax=Phocoena sinus TaxID=42100 RepID=UPI0013C3F7A9|nr:regulator of G-protein signaling 19 isoform X2 [Phocoena sinus]